MCFFLYLFILQLVEYELYDDIIFHSKQRRNALRNPGLDDIQLDPGKIHLGGHDHVFELHLFQQFLFLVREPVVLIRGRALKWIRPIA